jgi:hypothetical protein
MSPGRCRAQPAPAHCGVVWPQVLLVMAWLLALARPKIAGLVAAVRAVAGLDGTAAVGRRPAAAAGSARCSWRELSVSPDTC